MELLTNHSFKYDLLYEGMRWYDTPLDIGKFNNSSWSFMFCYENGYCMKITRSSTSQSFAIECTLSLLYINGIHKKERYLKYTNDGEANVLFPLCAGFLYSVKEFSGSITILRLPAFSVANFVPSPRLSDDMLGLLDNPDTFPDATLKCGAEEILVHKNILSVRSPVFSAMFKNKMQEGSSGIVEIADIEPNVLQATLKYVYSGQTDHFDDGIVGEVLYAANKYQLEELKKVCVDKLKSSMTVDNVFHIVVLGDLHDEGLKAQAKAFVCECDTFSNLKKTKGWKLLQSENPGLAMEVLLYVVDFAQKLLTENRALNNRSESWRT